MKAAVYYGPNNTKIEQIEEPECPKGGVILKVHCVGICGSDVRTYYSGSTKLEPPIITGHEVAGEVVTVDKTHSIYNLGDRLAMAPGIFCGKCYYCQHGIRTMCENLIELGFQYPGGFAEYMPIPEIAFERGRIVKIPDGLSYEHASLCEPSSSCVMAQERAEVQLGETFVIFGAGPIGCIHIEVAKARGAARIILVEADPHRLEMAKPFGADVYINGRNEDPIERVKEITGRLGADKVVVAAPSAVAQKQAVEICRRRGTVLFFGGLPIDMPYAEINSNTVHYHDICIMGHYGQEKHHVEQSLKMILRGQISAKKFISEIIPLEDIVKGFELIKDKKALKILIRPG